MTSATSNEVLTAKTFTRQRALAMLQEFSPSRISAWLEARGVPAADAAAAAAQVTLKDSMGLAIARLRFLAHKEGRAKLVDADRQLYENPISAFAVQVQSEMVAAGFMGWAKGLREGVREARQVYVDWCEVFNVGPESGRAPLTREQVLRLVWDHLVLPAIDDKAVEAAVRKAARIYSDMTLRWINADDFAAEYRAAVQLQKGVRGPVRHADGWGFSASAMAGFVEEGRLPDLESEVRAPVLSADESGRVGDDGQSLPSVAETLIDKDAPNSNVPVEEVEDIDMARDAIVLVDRGRAKGLAMNPTLEYRHPDNRDSREAVAARHGCTVEAIRSAEAWLDAQVEILMKSRAS